MYYIFVVNGRPDKAAVILPELESQLKHVDIEYEIYRTESQGDATRFVNLYCDFNPKKEVCFVACGGSGTMNEVVSGIVGKKLKYFAVMDFCGTDDLLKSLPERNYRSVAALLGGERRMLDVMKANDNYSVNVINFGFDGVAAYKANLFAESGKDNYYIRGIVSAFLLNRYNNIKVVVDGEKIHLPFPLILMGNLGNGRYCGGEFLCAPKAELDDGWIEFFCYRAMTIIEFLLTFNVYRDGRHLDVGYSKRRSVYKRCRHVELSSPELIHLCLDGEIVASRHFDISIMEKSLEIILPKE